MFCFVMHPIGSTKGSQHPEPWFSNFCSRTLVSWVGMEEQAWSTFFHIVCSDKQCNSYKSQRNERKQIKHWKPKFRFRHLELHCLLASVVEGIANGWKPPWSTGLFSSFIHLVNCFWTCSLKAQLLAHPHTFMSAHTKSQSVPSGYGRPGGDLWPLVCTEGHCACFSCIVGYIGRE